MAETKPNQEFPKIPICMIDECADPNLIRQVYDGVWLTLCLEHTNRLVDYIGQTQQHEDYLIAHAAFRKAMSPFPSGSGMTNDAEAISENVRMEIIVRGFINEWLEGPDDAELRFRNEE